MIAATVAGDAASYTVVVTNCAGSVTSSAAVVTINVAPAITTQTMGWRDLARFIGLRPAHMQAR